MLGGCLHGQHTFLALLDGIATQEGAPLVFRIAGSQHQICSGTEASFRTHNGCAGKVCINDTAEAPL